jgi:hypothetical protein
LQCKFWTLASPNISLYLLKSGRHSATCLLGLLDFERYNCSFSFPLFFSLLFLYSYCSFIFFFIIQFFLSFSFLFKSYLFTLNFESITLKFSNLLPWFLCPNLLNSNFTSQNFKTLVLNFSSLLPWPVYPNFFNPNFIAHNLKTLVLDWNLLPWSFWPNFLDLNSNKLWIKFMHPLQICHQ